MNATQKTSDMFDSARIADRLRIPEETLWRLRRATDPALSFEEHADIFPLDLGPIWDLAAFQATKRVAPDDSLLPECFYRSPLKDQEQFLLRDWAPIYQQFSDIIYYGTEGRCQPSGIASGHFLFQQSDVSAHVAQRNVNFHVDGGDTKAAFKDHWKPPLSLILHARDVPPVTVYIKGLENLPHDLIDHDFTSSMRNDAEAFVAEARSKLGPNHPVIKLYEMESKTDPIGFCDGPLADLARSAGKLLTFPAGHVIALTDRVLHAGQAASYARRQTFAFGQGLFAPL